MDPLRAALESLPHGPEFRFLDRLITLSPGKAATAQYTVRGDEPFLAGHFPGQPMFPGVLLVEAAAQLAGIVVQSGLSDSSSSPLRLTGLRAVKILGTAHPGETICLEAHLGHQLGNLIQASATATVGKKAILRAELTLSRIRPTG